MSPTLAQSDVVGEIVVLPSVTSLEEDDDDDDVGFLTDESRAETRTGSMVEYRGTINGSHLYA